MEPLVFFGILLGGILISYLFSKLRPFLAFLPPLGYVAAAVGFLYLMEEEATGFEGLGFFILLVFSAGFAAITFFFGLIFFLRARGRRRRKQQHPHNTR